MEIALLGNGTTGETLVELLEDKSTKTVTIGDSISIGFAVESLDAQLETVKNRGIPVHSGPLDTPGSRFFCIKDPNGLNVQFFQMKQ